MHDNTSPDISFTSLDVQNLLQGLTGQNILLFGSTGTIGKGAITALRNEYHIVTPVARTASTGKLSEHSIKWEDFLSYNDTNTSLKEVTTIISCIGGFVDAQTRATASNVTDEQIEALNSKVFKPNLQLYQQTTALYRAGCLPKLNRMIFITGTNGESPEQANFCAASMADARLISLIQNIIKEQQKQQEFRVVEVRLGLRFSEKDQIDKRVPSYASTRLGKVFQNALITNDELIRVTDSSSLDLSGLNDSSNKRSLVADDPSSKKKKPNSGYSNMSAYTTGPVN